MIPTTRAASTPSLSVTTNASNTNTSHRLKSRLRSHAVVAEPADLERVARGLEPVRPADLRLESDDAGAHELHYPAAAGADQVVMMLAAMDVLVEEPVAPEALLADQAAVH